MIMKTSNGNRQFTLKSMVPVISLVVVIVIVVQLELVNGDVWTKWGDRAGEVCLSAVRKAGLSEPRCDTVQEVIETAMQALTLQIASGLGKDPKKLKDEIFMTSRQKGYEEQGERIIKSIVDWVVAENVVSEKKIYDKFVLEYGQWFLHMGLGKKPNDLLIENKDGEKVRQIIL